MMNLFRLVGDLSHVLAVFILLAKIWKTKSAAGISGKSQVLFSLVYLTRYLDLFTSYISMYNTVMKLLFISASCATVYLIYIRFKATYDGNHDTFRIELAIIPSLILAFIFHYNMSFFELCWSFSIFLEAVAILPQLFMVTKTGEAENITSHYLFALGSYRGLYILNWIYRYYTEGHFDPIAVSAGIVQTVLYCDFFYLYVTKVLQGRKLQVLP
eukprot:TRINITY_DN10663_c0_g1_i1.p2 TRINITY_DN10663_c0_g1~~TRINITY_DN10663_c0_g1_i1.p2  ORF type:complete len:214 (+),score=26.21 TRINITY_DN10663_c0_g1_i1:75-716(+)